MPIQSVDNCQHFFSRVIYQRFLDQKFLYTSNMRNHFDKATVGDFINVFSPAREANVRVP